jgi:hypothetical protein
MPWQRGCRHDYRTSADIVQFPMAATAVPNTPEFGAAVDAWLKPLCSDQRLSPSAKLVCHTFARWYFNSRHFSATGRLIAWPEWATLMARTRLSKMSINRAIDTLEEIGALAVERGRYDPTTGQREHNRYEAKIYQVSDCDLDQVTYQVSNCDKTLRIDSKAPRTIAGFGDSALAERTSAGLVPR